MIFALTLLALAGFPVVSSRSRTRARTTAPPQKCGGLGDPDDWLVAGCTVASAVTTTTLSDGSTEWLLANGVVSRRVVANHSNKLLATVSIEVLAGQGAGQKLGPAPGPDALLVINDVAVVVGGGPPVSAADTRPRATFAGARTVGGAVAGGGFHWVPGARGSNPATAWPPKGVHVEFDHALDCEAVGAGAGTVVATTVLELYDQASAFGRRLRLAHNCSTPLHVYNTSVSVLDVLHDRTITTHTDAAVSLARLVTEHFPPQPPVTYHTSGFLSTPGLAFFGPGLSSWRATDPTFESYFVAEVVRDVGFETVMTPTHRGMTRYGLLAARMNRVLTPQTEQTPIKVNGFCTGGVKHPPADGVEGSTGLWCYDDEGTSSMKALVAQCAEAGVDILGFSLNMNGTWRSEVGNEFQSEANMTWLKAVVDLAHAGQVEVGAYQLLLNARSATALNQAAPRDAETLPNAGYDCMDPVSRQTCHNGGRPGACAMCGATEFYDAMEVSMHAWWRATGVSVVLQDGAESMTPCANESHAHHHGLNDSVWEQYKAVRRTFNTYLTTPMHARRGEHHRRSARGWSPGWSVPKVGFIAGMPGSIMEAGEAKVPGGYSEEAYSLPRWVWIDRTRELIIASPVRNDQDVTIGQRMYPIPFSGPYHPTEPDPDHPDRFRPVVGYDSLATLSPLEEHVPETEWALSTYFGTGVMANMRARKLWDGPRSEACVKKWIGWAKRYHRVLSAESVTLRHGTVCWDKDTPLQPNSTCSRTGVDAILHRAPKAYYSDIEERGLAMVWNPTDAPVTATIEAPLYYAGLTADRGVTAVQLSREGMPPALARLGVNDTVALAVSLEARTFTWFVITE